MESTYTAAKHKALVKAFKAATTKEERNRITRELVALLAAGGDSNARFVQQVRLRVTVDGTTTEATMSGPLVALEPSK